MLEVGRVIRPHGVRGEVIVDLVSNRPERRLGPGSVLHGDGRPLEVAAARSHQGRWIVAFTGVADRNGAEGLRGVTLTAEPLDDEAGTLWVHELVGSEVVGVDGRRFGEVVAVESNPASDLLVLADERLVPLVFVKSHVPGHVVIDPPDGLLD